MEIREIDGKKFIEYKEHRQQRKRLLVSVLFMVIMVVAIVALINTTVTLVKSRDLIGKDPLRYGMEVHGFLTCQCFDQDGNDWYSEGDGFIHRERGPNWINYSLGEFQNPTFEVDRNGSG